MTNSKKIALAVLVIVVGTVSVAMAATRRYSASDAANYTRACRFPNAPVQITTSGSSQQTSALSSGTVYRVLCATATYFAQGSNPTAAATSLRIVADVELYVLSQADKFAFLQVASAGVCEVTECE